MLLKKLFLILCLQMSLLASASQLSVGAQFGALDLRAPGVSSDLAYGVYLNVWGDLPFGFQLDFATADFSLDKNSFYVSPSALLPFVNYDELKAFAILGPALHEVAFEGDNKFALQAGAGVDLFFIPQFSVGLQSRYHWVFGSKDWWSVMSTVSFSFDIGSSWDW